MELPKSRETIVSGRGDSEHRLNELQRWERAATISLDTRDGHETLRLLLQPPRSLCASKVSIHTSPPRTLCSPPLPGSCDPQTSSLREHMARLRLLQRHASLCCLRLAPHSVLLLPTGLSDPQAPKSSASLTPSCLGEEQMPEGDLHAKAGPNPKLNPKSCVKKNRKGNLSVQPQELQIKSPQ